MKASTIKAINTDARFLPCFLCLFTIALAVTLFILLELAKEIGGFPLAPESAWGLAILGMLMVVVGFAGSYILARKVSG